MSANITASFGHFLRWVEVSVAGNRAIFSGSKSINIVGTSHSLQYGEATEHLMTVESLYQYLSGESKPLGTPIALGKDTTYQADTSLRDIYINGDFQSLTLALQTKLLTDLSNTTESQYQWDWQPSDHQKIVASEPTRWQASLSVENISQKEMDAILPGISLHSMRYCGQIENGTFSGTVIIETGEEEWIRSDTGNTAPVDTKFSQDASNFQKLPRVFHVSNPQIKLRLNMGYQLRTVSEEQCDQVAQNIQLGLQNFSPLDADMTQLDYRGFYRHFPAFLLDKEGSPLTFYCTANQSISHLKEMVKTDIGLDTIESESESGFSPIASDNISGILCVKADSLKIDGRANILNFIQKTGGLTPQEAMEFLNIDYGTYVNLTLDTLDTVLSQADSLEKKNNAKQQVVDTLVNLLIDTNSLKKIDQVITTLEQRASVLNEVPLDVAEKKEVELQSMGAPKCPALFKLDSEDTGTKIDIPFKSKPKKNEQLVLNVTVPEYFANLLALAKQKRSNIQ